MNIRPATPQDIASVAALLSELRGETTTPEAIQQDYDFLCEHPHCTALVLEDEGEVRGMCVVNLVHKLPVIEARVDEVVVSGASRGKGYGRAIMEACEQWCWQHGAGAIEFTSRASREAANALYQKLGYQIRETNVYKKVKE